MAQISTLVAHIEKMAGHTLHGDEGVFYGPVERKVGRVVVCWMAGSDALLAAARSQADLVITHESLFYPYDIRLPAAAGDSWPEWPTNRERLDLMQRHDMSVLRIHGSADEICIYDDFAKLIGLEKVASGSGYERIFEIEPCTVAELTERVKQAAAMKGVRVAAPRGLDQRVSRIGLPWGGMALFVNVAYQQRLVAAGCDALIAGETDNYGFRFAAELGIPMIETSHEVSENPGLRHFCEMLQTAFPQIEFLFFENAAVWEMK